MLRVPAVEFSLLGDSGHSIVGLYNLDRPHESLRMQAPAQRYRPTMRAFPKYLPAIESCSVARALGVPSTRPRSAVIPRSAVPHQQSAARPSRGVAICHRAVSATGLHHASQPLICATHVLVPRFTHALEHVRPMSPIRTVAMGGRETYVSGLSRQRPAP